MMDDEVTLVWPERPTCHDKDPFAQNFEPASWELRTDGQRHCSYCGSLHPEDLYRAILVGAKLGGADWKFSWPHKFYVEGVPNANVGKMVRRMSSSFRGDEPTEDDWARVRAYATKPGSEVRVEEEDYIGRDGKPARSLTVFEPDTPTTHGKFYNTHLRDLDDVAFSAMSEILMKHTNIRFTRDSEGMKFLAPRHGYQKP